MGTIYRWIGGSGGYGATTDWTPTGVPGSDDNATIDLTGVLVTAGPANYFIVGLASAGSLLLANTATLAVANGADVIVGNSASASGNLAITSGAHLIDQDGTVGDLIGNKAGSSGAALVTGAGSSWQTTGRLFVGVYGSGSLAISDGGYVSTGNTGSASDQSVYVGQNAGAAGLLTVSGPGSSLIANGRIGAGVAGTGTLEVLNGATVATTAAVTPGYSAIYAGGLAGGSGFISVSGAGSVLNPNGGEITVGAPSPTSTGALASGTLVVAGGARVSAGASVDLTQYSALDVGNETNGSGVFLLIGAGSTVNLTGQFTDGNSGIGAATIQGGATLTAGDPSRATSSGISIANTVGGAGSLLIDGAGTQVYDTGRFSVGRNGVGTLIVSGGAFVSSTGNAATGALSMTLGASAGASGFETVTGAGTLVKLAGGLAVAGGGSLISGGGVAVTPGGAGSLGIAAGGVVTVAGGATIFASGKVSLTGGAFETDTLALYGGSLAGAGTVTGAVADNGTITASGGTLGIGGSVSGGGSLAIASGAVLDVAGAIAAGLIVNFGGGTNETLQLGSASAALGTLANLAVGDTIDLLGFAAGSVGAANGVLTIAGAGAQAGQTLSLQLSGSGGLSFTTNPDGGTGTDVVVGSSQSTALPNVSGSFTNAINAELTAAVVALVAAGTTPNVVSVVGGQSAGAPISGALNAVVVTSATNGATIALPTGFAAGYLLAGGATLQDSVGGAALIDTAAGSALIGAASDTLFGGNAGATLFATTGAETLVGGTGTNAFFLGSSTAQVTSQGNDVITGSSVAATINASGSALYFGTSGATDFIASGTGGDTIIGGSNGNTVQGGGGGQLIFAASSLNYTGGAGSASIIGGGGGNTVVGGSGGLLAFASSTMTYTGTGGSATLIGGSGPLNAALGTGGGIAYGGTAGGDALSTASSTQSILVGGGAGDVLTATGSGADVLVAATGAETINGAAATGNLVIFGGSGPDSLAGGAGNDLFVPGSANETMTGGGGSNFYVFLGSAATTRTDLITDFNPSKDALALFGYQPDADAAALASATVVGNNTVVTLTDGTSIQFAGAPTLNSFNFY